MVKQEHNFDLFTTIRLICMVLVVSFLGGATQNSNTSDTATVTYCDLVRNHQLYDGKEVTVRATYRYGFEWSEIYCLNCLNIGRTWIEFDESVPEAALKRFKPNGAIGRTVNAVFRGSFHSGEMHYGHESQYRFKFLVKSVRAVHAVYKEGLVPQQLPLDARRKACQN